MKIDFDNCPPGSRLAAQLRPSTLAAICADLVDAGHPFPGVYNEMLNALCQHCGPQEAAEMILEERG